MKKILLSVGSILFVAALLAGGTGAFLQDGGTSTGNTFATGVIDLKIDNESYYTDDWGKLTYSSSTSWALSTLAGKLFFNFSDVKPGDIGEDTISLHVHNNNAYACMNVLLTDTPENGQNEPEAIVDPTGGVSDGELQNFLYFSWWADDGDNVFEQGEKTFKQGLARDIFNGKNWALADGATNIWDTSGPIPGGATRYIGKAWCFGTMTPNPLPQDGKGKTGANGPLSRGTGFSCSGKEVGNIVQSDGIKVNVSFSVAQSRNNSGYRCEGGEYVPPPKHASTFMSDNFDSYVTGKEWDEVWSDGSSNFNWDEVGGVTFVPGLSGKVADLDAGANDPVVANYKETLTATAIDTTGYGTIVFTYSRKTDDTNAPPQAVGPQTLTVDYSVNGGASWTTLETVTGESNWTTKTFSLSPSADNKVNIKVRFTLTGQDATNHAYIDNVAVTGVSL
jgi:hypothetical protein